MISNSHLRDSDLEREEIVSRLISSSPTSSMSNSSGGRVLNLVPDNTSSSFWKDGQKIKIGLYRYQLNLLGDFKIPFPKMKEIRLLDPHGHEWCLGKKLVGFIVRGSPCLEILALEFRTECLSHEDPLDNGVLTGIFENRCSSLKYLDLLYPPLLTNEFVRTVHQSCPLLDHLGNKNTWILGDSLDFDGGPQ